MVSCGNRKSRVANIDDLTEFLGVEDTDGVIIWGKRKSHGNHHTSLLIDSFNRLLQDDVVREEDGTIRLELVDNIFHINDSN
jgi:hypothetical protein